MGITRAGNIITISRDGAGATGDTFANAFVAQDVYDESVVQGWGTVHKQGANQFKFDDSIWIGAHSSPTFIKFLKEDILFCGEEFRIGGGTMPWHYYPGAVYFGEIVNGEPVNGSTFTFGYTGGAAETVLWNKAVECHLYNSQIKTVTTVPSKIKVYNGAPLIMNRSIIDGVTAPIYNTTSAWMLDIDDSVIQNASQGIYMESAAKRLVLNNLIFKNCTTGIFNFGMGGKTTLLNLKTKNTPLLVEIDTSGWMLRLVNPVIETWHVDMGYPDNRLYRAYEFILKVVDVNNAPISGAAVEIKDVNNSVVVDMITDADGLLIDSGTAESGSKTTLTDTDKSWSVDIFEGFLIEITAGTGVGQKRGIEGNTSDTIKIGSGNLNNWKINPDNTSEYKIIPVLDYGYLDLAHGDVFTMSTPHDMTIKHYDYTTIALKLEASVRIEQSLTMVADPWITKNKAGASAIGGSCTP